MALFFCQWETAPKNKFLNSLFAHFIYIYILYIYIYISFFSEGLRIPGIPLWKGLLLLYRYHLNPKTPIFHYMIVTTFNWRCGQVHRVPKSGGYPRKTRGWWLLVGCEPNRVQKIDAIDSGWSSIDRPRGIPKLWCDWSFFFGHQHYSLSGNYRPGEPGTILSQRNSSYKRFWSTGRYVSECFHKPNLKTLEPFNLHKSFPPLKVDPNDPRRSYLSEACMELRRKWPADRVSAVMFLAPMATDNW